MADHGEYREELDGDHPHSYDHTEPKGSLLFVFGGVTIVLLILTTIAIEFYYRNLRETELYNRVLTPENYDLRDLRAKEDRELHSFGYSDKAAGKVRVTIDRAMELVAQEAKENRPKYPTTAYAVKTPEQLAAAAAPAVSPQGAAAVNNPATQGTGSNPNVQQPSRHK